MGMVGRLNTLGKFVGEDEPEVTAWDGPGCCRR